MTIVFSLAVCVILEFAISLVLHNEIEKLKVIINEKEKTNISD